MFHFIFYSVREPKAPRVSIAMGMNSYSEESRELYLDLVWHSAKAATAPESLIAAGL